MLSKSKSVETIQSTAQGLYQKTYFLTLLGIELLIGSTTKFVLILPKPRNKMLSRTFMSKSKPPSPRLFKFNRESCLDSNFEDRRNMNEHLLVRLSLSMMTMQLKLKVPPKWPH